MTNKAWATCTEHLMSGYLNSEFFKDDPDWEMIDFLDEFISNETVVQATISRRDSKVNPIK